jgi:hypothetical protein
MFASLGRSGDHCIMGSLIFMGPGSCFFCFFFLFASLGRGDHCIMGSLIFMGAGSCFFRFFFLFASLGRGDHCIFVCVAGTRGSLHLCLRRWDAGIIASLFASLGRGDHCIMGSLIFMGPGSCFFRFFFSAPIDLLNNMRLLLRHS